jgi:hypothetical protein
LQTQTDIRIPNNVANYVGKPLYTRQWLIGLES